MNVVFGGSELEGHLSDLLTIVPYRFERCLLPGSCCYDRVSQELPANSVATIRLSHSAQQESFAGSLYLEIAAIFSASAIVG